jgi:glycine oxidase
MPAKGAQSMATADVAVVGGGLIGTAIAWRCAQRGLSVAVVDPEPSRGAWRTAAGMLAPVTELHYTESPLLRLNLESNRRYPGFVAELAEVTGLSTGYRECGTVDVAWDGADLAALRDLHRFGASLGLPSRLLTASELRSLEPALAPGLPGALLAEYDHQVDPRLLHAALQRAAERLGAVCYRSAAVVAGLDTGRVDGVLLEDGDRVSAAVTVLAAGAWSGALAGIAPVPVRPVQGSTLRVRLPAPLPLSRVIRGSVRGMPIYLVPRVDGEIVVGASSEEAGFGTTPRARAVYELLRDAQAVFPEIGEAAFLEVSTGFRPGTPDNAPIVGASGIDGLVLATGHYRNGVLLTPVTADGVADLVTTGTIPDVLAPFGPKRLDAAAVR